MKGRKTAALVLAAALALWGGRTAYAQGLGELAASAEDLVDLYLWSSPKAKDLGVVTSAELLEEIPKYTFRDGVLEPFEGHHDYPVSTEDGRIFGIFMENHSGGEGAQFSGEYAEQLMDFTRRSDRLCIVFDDFGMYFLSPDTREKVPYFPWTPDDADVADAAGLNYFYEAGVDLGSVRFWDARDPAHLATLRISQEDPLAYDLPEAVPPGEPTAGEPSGEEPPVEDVSPAEAGTPSPAAGEVPETGGEAVPTGAAEEDAAPTPGGQSMGWIAGLSVIVVLAAVLAAVRGRRTGGDRPHS